MKKIILLILFGFILNSCVEKEVIDESLKVENIINNNSLKGTSLNDFKHLDLYDRLQFIAYISGKIILENEQVRSQIVDMLDEINTLNINELLFNDSLPNDFKNEYFKVFGSLLLDKPIDPSGDIQFDRFFNDDLLRDIIEFHDNCYELYFPVPLLRTLNTEDLITSIPHPLAAYQNYQERFLAFEFNNLENDFLFQFVEIDDDFEHYFFNNYTSNVIVARLETDNNNCNYLELDETIDFTEFLAIP